MSKDLKQHSLALAGYLAVAIIFSYPLILNFTTSVLGPMEDNMVGMWQMWWMKFSLIEGKTPLFSTDYMFYPKGIDLSFNTYAYAKTITSIIFQPFFDFITIYNIFTLSSYVLSGFGVYLLVRHLVGRGDVGFICGLIYTMAPAHVWHLDHSLDVTTLETMPLFILYFIRFYQDRMTKDLIISGIFLVLAALTCSYYMMFLLYFLLIFFGYFFYAYREEIAGMTLKTMAMLAGTFIAIFPILYPIFKAKLSGGEYQSAPSSFNCVVDLIAPFVPSSKHPIAGWLNLEAFYKDLPCFAWETNVFVGYSVLILAVFGFIKVKNKWTSLMALTCVVFWMFSWGSQLQWGGEIVLDSIYLPYFWLVKQMPVISSMRTPSRFMAMAMLALTVLYGYGLDFLMGYLVDKRNYPAKTVKAVVPVLAGALIFLEFMPFPNTLLKVEEVTQAKFLARNLPGEVGEYGVLELPLMNNYVYQQMQMYRQVRHHQKILGGNAGRVPLGAHDFISQGPLRILRDAPNRADLNYFKSLKPYLTQNRIKYIVLNRYMVTDPQYTDFIEKSLRQVFASHGELNPKIGLYQVY